MLQKDKYYTMLSLGKALLVIETMATDSDWKLKTLSDACSIPKGTLQRILRTLEDLGYVRQIERGGTYSLTLKFNKLGKQIASQSNLATLMHPILHGLRDKVNETTILSILSGVEMVVVHQKNSTHALHMDSIIGTSFPAGISASGKSYLAFLPEEELRDFIKELRRSDADIDTEKINQIYKEIESTRRRGISFDFEELFKGIRCVAAPIFDDSEHITATISCSVPTVRLDKTFSQQLLQEIPLAAAEASRLLEASERSFHFDMDETVNLLLAT